jgi:Phage integrase family
MVAKILDGIPRRNNTDLLRRPALRQRTSGPYRASANTRNSSETACRIGRWMIFAGHSAPSSRRWVLRPTSLKNCSIIQWAASRSVPIKSTDLDMEPGHGLAPRESCYDRGPHNKSAAMPKGLRHSFGVNGFQNSVPPHLVQRWLGHGSLETTAIYGDVSGSEEREFAARGWRRQNLLGVLAWCAHRWLEWMLQR